MTQSDRPAASTSRINLRIEADTRQLFVLDAEHHDAFIQALDNPPAPGPKLRALLRRTPAWQK